MEDILARARKVAEEAEVFTVSSEQTPIQFEANRLKHIQTKQSTSTALRIIKNGRIGYATTTELEAGQDLVDMAVETAQFGMPAKFELPPSTKYPKVEVFDSEVESVPLEAMVKLGEEMVAAVTAHTPGIMCEAGVTKSTASVSIKNSRGGETDYQISVFSLGVMGTLIRDTDMLFVGESDTSCHPI
ncbi:PmbA/TldA family metallopeptidase, partial [Bacteroidota bacterium]